MSFNEYTFAGPMGNSSPSRYNSVGSNGPHEYAQKQMLTSNLGPSPQFHISSLWAPTNRRSSNIDASNIWSTSTQPSHPSQENSPNLDYARRYSHNDVYSFQNNKPEIRQISPRESNESSTLNLVNEYFESDPHQRVKVTSRFVSERFFHEEKYLSDSYQLPRFPIDNSSRSLQLVLVGFKAGRIDVFNLSSNSEVANLKVGDLVLVEADRGRDLGKVVRLNVSIDEARLMKLLQFQEQQVALSDSDHISDDALSLKNFSNGDANPSSPSSFISPPTLHFPKSIISLAQPSDIIQILNKKQDEERACRLCLAKISNTTGAQNGSSAGSGTFNSSNTDDLLQMKLIDAEYQFDRKKLIFYYSTSKRIDFRDLVRELFRTYKTRIWMCAVVGLPYVPENNSGTAISNTQSRKSSLESRPASISETPSMGPVLNRRVSYNGGFGETPRRFSVEQSTPGSASMFEPTYQMHHTQQPRQQGFYYGNGNNNSNMNQAPPYLPPGLGFMAPSDGVFRGAVSRRGSVAQEQLWNPLDAAPYDNTASWNPNTNLSGEGYVLESLVESLNR